jgi:tRNA G26 N,N-dimethylase Trm1
MGITIGPADIERDLAVEIIALLRDRPIRGDGHCAVGVRAGRGAGAAGFAIERAS